MKPLLQRVRWAFVFLLLVFLPLTYLGLYRPMRTTLETSTLDHFRHVAQAKADTLQGFVDRSVENAISLSSRTAIRQFALAYLEGEQTLEALIAFTTPRYGDGVEALEHVRVAQRVVDGRVIAGVGQSEPAGQRAPFERVVATLDVSKQTLEIFSPLIEGGRYLGYDRILVDLAPLVADLSTDGYLLTLHGEKESPSFGAEWVVHTEGLDAEELSHAHRHMAVRIEKDRLFAAIDASAEGTLRLFWLAIVGVGLVFHLTTLRFTQTIVSALERQVAERTADLRARSYELEEMNAALEEEIEAREKAEESTEAKEQLIAELGHDIRTPLGGMSGILQLLEREALDESQEELVSMLKRSTQALDDLLGNVLDRARLASGLEGVNCEQFSPQTVVAEVVELYETLAREKGIQIRSAKVPGDVPAAVFGDPFRLRQILSNLVSNAVKYTAHGQVGLAVRSVPGKDDRIWLRFEVADTGVGILPERIDRLFDRFSRGEPTTDRMATGTGLGLAIVRGLVTLLEGEIQVESQVGEGSVFSVTLPFAPASSD